MADTSNFTIEIPTAGGNRNSWGGILNVAIQKIDELMALAMPIGTIQMYTKADGTAPTATTNGGTWLVCDGGSLARLGDYAELFALIGTTYGVGSSSNSSTFSLPDLRARVPVGYNASVIDNGSVNVRSARAISTTTGGTETHLLVDAEIPKHTHPITDAGHDHDTTETAHTHTGETADASTSITIADHTHKTFGSDGYVVDPWHNSPANTISAGSGIDGDHYGTFKTGTQLVTGPGATPITDPSHKHSIGEGDLGTTSTDLTIDLDTTGITVNEQGTGDTAHNIMQPYLVVQYIILAKHPTF